MLVVIIYIIYKKKKTIILFNILYVLQSWNLSDAPTNIFLFMLQNRDSDKKKEDFLITVGDL